MYYKEDEILDNETDLIHYLCEKYKDFDGKQIIMSGHYFLLYDQEEKKLLPSIKEEVNDKNLQAKVNIIIKDFPLKTFKIGLSLYKQFKYLKTALLVNDQYFRSKAINHDKSKILTPGFELRKNYFHNPDSLPTSYRDLLSKNKIKEHDFFLINHQPDASDKTKLPKKSYFFAESILNKRFKYYTLKQLLKGKSLYCSVNEKDKEIRYSSARRKNDNSFCVVGNDASPCIAVAIQFFYDMFIKYAALHIIMLIPKDCEDSVNKAAEIVLEGLEDVMRRITVISNLEFDFDEITLRRHFYEE